MHRHARRPTLGQPNGARVVWVEPADDAKHAALLVQPGVEPLVAVGLDPLLAHLLALRVVELDDDVSLFQDRADQLDALALVVRRERVELLGWLFFFGGLRHLHDVVEIACRDAHVDCLGAGHGYWPNPILF